MASQSVKQRSKKISNNDSDDAFLACQTSQPRSSSLTKKNVSRFLLILLEKESESNSSLSLFLVHKPIMSIVNPESIKNLRSGELLIQCAKAKQLFLN